METAVFAVGALICLLGAAGVVLNENPVHCALSLVGTLFGVAVLFVAQDAEFLAAVQVIVYAGAIVVLFLFVIMLIGVDRTDDLSTEPLVGQRQLAVVAGVLLAAGLAAVLLVGSITGKPSSSGKPSATSNVEAIGRTIFTDHVFAFEITSILLVIAVVGAVTLARHSNVALVDEYPADQVPASDEEIDS